MTQAIATMKNEKKERKRKKKKRKRTIKEKKRQKPDYITLGILHILHILNSVLCILDIHKLFHIHSIFRKIKFVCIRKRVCLCFSICLPVLSLILHQTVHIQYLNFMFQSKES